MHGAGNIGTPLRVLINNAMKTILIIIAVIIVLAVIVEIGVILFYIHKSSGLIKESKSFSRNTVENGSVCSEHILILGDSLGVGVGAAIPEESIAGRVAADHKNTCIKNISVSGAKIANIKDQLEAIGADEKFDAILLFGGGNDIVQLSKLPDVLLQLQSLLLSLRKHSHKIIFTACGNVGLAPAFIFPLDVFYTGRAKEFLGQFKVISDMEGIYFVDLYHEKKEDPFEADPKKFYERDGFHPSSAGYEIWYEKIKRGF